MCTIVYTKIKHIANINTAAESVIPMLPVNEYGIGETIYFVVAKLNEDYK